MQPIKSVVIEIYEFFKIFEILFALATKCLFDLLICKFVSFFSFLRLICLLYPNKIE